MTVLPYRDHGYVRILSTRTGETLFEIKMLGGQMHCACSMHELLGSSVPRQVRPLSP